MTDELCHCGRPYRHIGPHWGPNHRERNRGDRSDEKCKVGRPSHKLLFQLLGYEIDRCETTLRETPEKIERLHASMKSAEARLSHLIALREVYQPTTPPTSKPELAAAKPKVVAVVAVPAKGSVVAVPSAPTEVPTPKPEPKPKYAAPRKPQAGEVVSDEWKYEAIEATTHDVGAWAAQHSINFRTWDDLPGVNIVREDMLLPIFKRSFAKQRSMA